MDGPEDSLGWSTLQLGSPGLPSQSKVFRVFTCVLGPEHILKNKAEREVVAGSLLLFIVNLVFSLHVPLSHTLLTPWDVRRAASTPPPCRVSQDWKGFLWVG